MHLDGDLVLQLWEVQEHEPLQSWQKDVIGDALLTGFRCDTLQARLVQACVYVEELEVLAGHYLDDLLAHCGARVLYAWMKAKVMATI